MPIYVYKCSNCEATAEVIELVSHNEPLECTCGGEMQRAVAGHAWTPKKWEV